MNRHALVSALLLVASPLAGCIGQTSENAPIVPIRNMYDQPRYDAQGPSAFFEDGRAMRPQVEGTVPREADPEISHHTGRNDDNTEWLMQTPAPVVERLGGMEATLERGHQRYDIYCVPCHAASGDGEGMVAHRSNELGTPLQPPTFHDDRIRHMPDGQLYATITNGIRLMPAYSQSIPQDDRWAIVSYVRALQLGTVIGGTR